MPLRERLIRVFGKTAIMSLYLRLYPTGLGVEHQMRVLRRDGQIGVDRRCKGMHQFGPVRIPQPKRTGAVSTEVAATITDIHLASHGIGARSEELRVGKKSD